MITLKYTRLLSNKYTILIERCKYTKSSLIIICFLYFFFVYNARWRSRHVDEV